MTEDRYNVSDTLHTTDEMFVALKKPAFVLACHTRLLTVVVNVKVDNERTL